ncbi:MAG: PorT family protein [Flavobacteriaceae bacterium]|nr:PorT family protein [Flavobacteriaceae bacterium]
MKPQAQVNNDSIIDLKYLEDQLYLSLTYSILNNKPAAISQNGFSGGYSIGFIKDIPLNERRNVGLGIGAGYAYKVYVQNLKISRDNQTTIFDLAEDYKTNRLGINAIEMPIELRWRTSTPQKYSFWRVYGGVKFSYLVASKTKFEDADVLRTTRNIPELNRIQYGVILAVGYSTWNIYCYYGLSPLFKNATFEEKNLDLKDINIGLKFYIM